MMTLMGDNVDVDGVFDDGDGDDEDDNEYVVDI